MIDDDYTKLVFTNENLSGTPGTINREDLRHFSADIKSLVSAIKSATTAGTVKEGRTTIDPTTGRAESYILVKKDSLENITAVTESRVADITSSRGYKGKYAYSFEDMSILTGYRTFSSNQALMQAKYNAQKYGLTVERAPTADNPNRYAVSMQANQDMLKGLTQEEIEKRKEKFFDNVFKGAEGLEIESRKKSEAKEKEADNKKRFATITKILAFVGTAVTVLRRILTAVMSMQEQRIRDANTAVTSNVSLAQAREMRFIDKALGMKEGTFSGAVGSVQGMFGDITNLNNKAIENLARVMGGGVKDLIMSGMGGQNPQQLLQKILDSYFAQYQSGYNSIGQYVGKESAGRELAQALRNVSPEIASVFTTMLMQDQMGLHKFNTMQQLIGATTGGVAGVSDSDLKLQTQIGALVNEMKASFSSVLDKYLGEISLNILGILNWLNRSKFGLSETEKEEQGKKNKAQNEANREKLLQQWKQSSDKTVGVDGMQYTAQELALFQAGVPLEEWSKYGVEPTSRGIYSKKDYGMKRGSFEKALVKASAVKGDFGTEAFYDVSLLETIREIEKEGTKPIHKQAGILASDALIKSKAKDYMAYFWGMGGDYSKLLTDINGEGLSYIANLPLGADVEGKRLYKGSEAQHRYLMSLEGKQEMLDAYGMVRSAVASGRIPSTAVTGTATVVPNEKTGSSTVIVNMFDERKQKVGEFSKTVPNELLREGQTYDMVIGENNRVSFVNMYSR